MAGSINSLLSMGTGALFASQAAINTTGNNITNVNTVGYSRQSVLLKSNTSLDSNPGQIGQGVSAEQIVRAYDKFIESSLVEQLGSAAKYDAAYYALKNVEGLFNESTVDGIGATLTSMFEAWNDLAQSAESVAAREALLSTSENLASLIQSADASLAAMQTELESLIQDEVTTANSLIKEIAELNRQINLHTVSGSNNANSLLDERDQKVRELAEIIDISIQDNGAGDYYVSTGAGHLLVQEDVAYSLSILGPTAENNLTAYSPYKNSTGSGTIGFSGTDTKEYTVEVVTGGAVDGGAQFRVSLDGGKTWLSDDSGNTLLFDANSEDNSVSAGNLTLWFDTGASLATGDKFVISPKNDIYWNSPTSGPINISSQYYGNGTENPLRITGGSLAGYLMARDEMVGSYRDELDTLAQSLIWEVNSLHSQGAGLTAMTSALAEYSVGRTDQALGGDTAEFAWSSYLEEGNLSFSIYDAETGESLIPYPGMSVLFSGGNFDPATMSLEDVRDAFNSASFTDAGGNTVNPFTAEIIDGRLQISVTSGYTFAVASDTSGLLAGLGLNTYFTGTGASSIAVRAEVAANSNLVNAGSVNGAGEINSGDNSIAGAMVDLLDKTVTLSSSGGAAVKQTLIDYYATLVTHVGSDTLSVKNAASREATLAQTLSDRREEVSGVSLDEELTSLIKYQSSYKAAAKLITTADEMLQTLLGLKQ